MSLKLTSELHNSNKACLPLIIYIALCLNGRASSGEPMDVQAMYVKVSLSLHNFKLEARKAVS